MEPPPPTSPSENPTSEPQATASTAWINEGAMPGTCRSERQIRIVEPLIVAPPLLDHLAGGPVFGAHGALGLDLELFRPLAERVAIPGHFRLQRRQAEFLPDLLGLLHVLAGRKRDRRIRALEHGVDQHRRIVGFVMIV